MNNQKMKKVFNLPKNLYTPGSPMIIEDGGLYKNDTGDKVFLSLNLKDIEAKDISSFKVKVQGYDTIWKPLGEAIEFSFDKSEKENLIELDQPDKALYAINAVVSHVTFADGSFWENTENQWIPLEDTDVTECKFFVMELLEERKRQFAEKGNRI